jgi:O-antigen/teichoic acid export membrane protein
MTEGQPRIGRRIAAGAAWMIGLRAADRLVGVISLTILARLLVPGDFGLVALAVATLAFFEMFGQTQVDVALIRDQGAERAHYDSAWTLDILRGAVLALILLAVAEPAAGFFAEPRLAPVLYVIAAIQLLGAFENVGVVDFRKELRFGTEFRYRFAARLAGATATVLLALAWRNHWALVAGMGLQVLIRVGLSYVMSGYRPRLAVSRIGEIFGFSKWVMAQNLFHGLREQAPTFLIGKLANVEVVGLFNLAREISAMVTTELRAPIRRALYPGFARMSVETGELRHGYLASFGVMVALSLPVAVGLYVLAAPVVAVLLGPQWLPAVPLLQILALHGIVQSFSASGTLIYNRLARPGLGAMFTLGYLVLFLPALLWGTLHAGAAGAAWAIVAVGAVMMVVDVAMVCRLLAVDAREVLAHLWRPVLAAAAMGAAVTALAARIDATGGFAALALLLVLAIVGAAIYAALLLAAWRLSGAAPGAERHILSVLGGILAARPPLDASSKV